MTTGPMLKLANGVQMPGLGFGTFANEGAVGETHKAVVIALNAGYRHLDCAWFYQNEAEVGSALKEFLAANPAVKREDIFITTKVWNHLHEPDEVEWSLNNSLEKFGTDYIDSFLIHWPIASEKDDKMMPKIGADGKVCLAVHLSQKGQKLTCSPTQYVIKKDLTENPEPTWRALEKLYKAGKAKSIGVSNWTIEGLEKLDEFAEIKPMVNQVEIHPFLPNTELVEYCFSHNILPVAYSPLGSQDQVPGTGEKVSTNKELNAIAAKNGYSLAQVLIAWGLKRGYSVLPKSSNEGRIKSNVQLITLTDEDYAAVNKVTEGRKTRFVNMKDTFGYDVWPEKA